MIWDAIAAHTSGFHRLAGIPQAPTAGDLDRRGRYRHRGRWHADRPAARVRRAGARCLPRLGGSRALADVIEAQALADRRKASPGSLAGELVRQRHPELPSLTWDAILASSGWKD
ncbi:hypothetical protein AB0H00_24180 [Nocardia sp. NPDC023852]|uniref:hypothetical protein n=1 Tax=Nocardia sp. NPDC023852 TaxID=3154697 RepID=UPI00340B27A7